MKWNCSTTKRLRSELIDFWRSDSFKKKVFSVDLVNDSLYEWNVKLHQIDDESWLFEDFQKHGESCEILLNIKFAMNYPFAAPFVRVVEPRITSE
jgi:ubiquitin-conjugating enzyme E2 Q